MGASHNVTLNTVAAGLYTAEQDERAGSVMTHLQNKDTQHWQRKFMLVRWIQQRQNPICRGRKTYLYLLKSIDCCGDSGRASRIHSSCWSWSQIWALKKCCKRATDVKSKFTSSYKQCSVNIRKKVLWSGETKNSKCAGKQQSIPHGKT